MSKWLNTKHQKHTPDEIVKPCLMCGFCPYGQIVEEYPFNDSISCSEFGHDCPVFYMAEPFVDREIETFEITEESYYNKLRRFVAKWIS